MAANELGRFSERHGYIEDVPEVTIREDAPRDLRHFVISFAEDSGLRISSILDVACKTLLKAPEGNWGPEYIRREAEGLLLDCAWFKVYDVAEAIYAYMEQHHITTSDFRSAHELYALKFNQFCIEKGIGWQFQNGKIVARGTEAFEATVWKAKEVLLQSQHHTAHNELHQAYADLSKRPEPDLTGAVQHAFAALECTAREVTGQRAATLGEIVKKSPQLFPQPLDEITKKIWGYASEKGRHLREGNTPTFAEALLMIGLSASIATFLNEPSSGFNAAQNKKEDFPWL